MSSLLAAETLTQGPVKDGQLARSVVVKQVAGMRIAVEDCLLSRGENRHSHQGFHELLSHSPAT